MTTVVIMPGGFHPFHAGHFALYQSAQRVFPDAEVFVAATNDTSARPFPFAVKEKLAQLAGVDAGHFVQVKSPFRADEITSQFDPEKDSLIFVRSEKDANQPPRAGGIKKDGSPAYLQPLLGAKKLEPFSRHAYMAYLPTVEFGPGLTSATEIRAAWPQLNDKRKTALVMSLYPRTQGNAKLAQTVVKMLDAVIGNAVAEQETSNLDMLKPALTAAEKGVDAAHTANNTLKDKSDPAKFDAFVSTLKKPAPAGTESVQENQGPVAEIEYPDDFSPAPYVFSGIKHASKEAARQGKKVVRSSGGYFKLADLSDPAPELIPNPNRDQAVEILKNKTASIKDFVNRLKRNTAEFRRFIEKGGYDAINKKLAAINAELKAIPTFIEKVKENQGWAATYEQSRAYGGQQGAGMTATWQRRENQPVDEDYVEEKWSQKYKRSINCASPKGFSQRAHCAGRKKNEAQQVDEKCWDTHRQAGMKKKGGRMVPNCVPKESKQ